MIDINEESVVTSETHLDGKAQHKLEDERDGEVLESRTSAQISQAKSHLKMIKHRLDCAYGVF